MTFSYTAPGHSDSDTVRFLVQDTIEEEHFLENEEIAWLLDQFGNKGTFYYTASKAADIIANKFAREIDVTSDNQTFAGAQLYARFSQLAIDLMSQHEAALVGGASLYAGGMDAYESPDPSVAPLSFGKGMHDNPEAGPQDYGDSSALEYAWRRAQWNEGE